MTEELLQHAWTRRMPALSFGAELKKLLDTNQTSSRSFCEILLRQVCLGATPSPLLLSYLHHCLSLSLLKINHFLELLPSSVNTSRPLQLGALLETVDMFILHIKPSIDLKDCFNLWYEVPDKQGDGGAGETQFDREAFLVGQILVQTCVFLSELVSGKVKRSQLQALNDQIQDNTLMAIQILKKVIADQRTSALIVVTYANTPDLVLQLKASCESSAQHFAQGPKLHQHLAKDFLPILDKLTRIINQKPLLRAGAFSSRPPHQELYTSTNPSLFFLFFVHFKMKRKLSTSDEEDLAVMERIIMAKEISKERAIFELYLAAMMGKAKLRQQEMAADAVFTVAPQKASHVWRALILAKIPKWIELLLAKDSIAADQKQMDSAAFERIISALSQFTVLVSLCCDNGDIMEEIAKTWIVRHFTTLEAMRKVLNNPNLELVFFGGNDSSTVPEDAVLQMVMKKEGNMLTFTEPQFKSIMESLVRAALSHAEMTKHISLQIVELLRDCVQDHWDKLVIVCNVVSAYPRMLDLLNLSNNLREVMELLELFCNNWKLEANGKEALQFQAFTSCFLLLLLAIIRFELRSHVKLLFAEPEGFCARWFMKSPGSLAQEETGKEYSDKEEMKFYLTALYHDTSSFDEERLRMSQPFKMVTLAPYLALQGCLACESGTLGYENLISGLKFMAKTTLFCHTIVGVIWCLCEELVIHSKDWKLTDWGNNGTPLPLPLAVISELILSGNLLPVIVRIASYRVQFAVGFLQLEDKVPQLLKKISTLSEELDAFPIFTHKEFDVRMKKEFSSVVHLGDRRTQNIPGLAFDHSIANGNLLINLDVFSDAIFYGGVRYFSFTIVEALLKEANHGGGMRAANFAAALLTNRLTYDPENTLTPDHVLSVLYSQILPGVIRQVRTSAEAVALGHFVANCLLFGSPKSLNPSSHASTKQRRPSLEQTDILPMEAQTQAMYQEALVRFTQLLSELVESVTKKPGPLLVFVVSFFSHPAISHCQLPLASLLKFASLLRSLGRDDLLLNLFDLRSPEEKLACAKLFAFPLKVISANQIRGV